ncbi:unnamed protein product [Ectocarpus sp. 12 AP-2014]
MFPRCTRLVQHRSTLLWPPRVISSQNFRTDACVTSSKRYIRHQFSTSTPDEDGDVREFKDRLRPLGPGRVDLFLDDRSGMATLVLDNHERCNALSGTMMVQLADAVNELEKWDRGVALVVHGMGGNFCAGADLSLAREHLRTGADGRSMCALMSDTLTRLRRLPLISVAAIDGAAIGGGAELATSCDFRVVGPESSIRFVQVKMGVSTGWGGGARLVGIVGRRAALRLLAWSPPLAGDEAVALGLVDAVAAEEGGSLAAAREFLGGVLTQDSHEAVRAVKKVVAAADLPVSERVHRAEADEFSVLWGGAHNRMALEPPSSPRPPGN